MIKKIGANAYGVVEYACSTERELDNLPALVGTGSTCIVIETGNVYMFDEEDKSWHSLTDIGEKIKPAAAYNPPKILSLNVSPENPTDGDSITFSYKVEYDESVLKEEKWVNKRGKYVEGTHVVKLQVQDDRGNWSNEKTLTFDVAKA